MNLQQIKDAIEQGKTVHWANNGYKVIKDSKGRYFIMFHTGHCTGLTWLDGVTLNGKEEQFYIAE